MTKYNPDVTKIAISLAPRARHAARAAVMGFSLVVAAGGISSPAKAQHSTPAPQTIEERIEAVEVTVKKLENDPKDFWDKLSASSGLITGGLVALIVFIATQWLTHRQRQADALERERISIEEKFKEERAARAEKLENERHRDFLDVQNQRETKVAKIQTIQGFIPHLVSDDPSTVKAALLVVEALEMPDLTDKLATLFGGKGSVEALFRVAEGRDPEGRERGGVALGKVLANYAPSVVKLSSPSGMATGFFINDQGLIVTTAHVARLLVPSDGDGTCEVTISDGTVYRAMVSKISTKFDLALVQSPSIPSRPMPLGEARFSSQFSQVAVMGSLRGGEIVANFGRLTAWQTTLTGVDVFGIGYEVKTGPGMSGSPVIDDTGKVIGVHHSFDRTTNTGFAILATDISKAFPDIMIDEISK